MWSPTPYKCGALREPSTRVQVRGSGQQPTRGSQRLMAPTVSNSAADAPVFPEFPWFWGFSTFRRVFSAGRQP